MADHTTSWLTLAGTALSGLGTTINGLNSLYGLSSQVQHLTSSAEAAVPAITGSVVSGTMALTGGWLTAAKLSSAGAGLSISTVGLGAGCLYASVGFLWFIYSIARLNTDVPPIHAPVEGSSEFAQYPEPEWLSTRVLNWGVMGRVGVGKSTLINSLRGLHAKSPDAAPVGVGHTTRRPHPYNFAGDIALLTRNMARLWDLPGAGTKDWPGCTYIRDAGLRHFDGVVFVTAGAFSEAEVDLMNQLMGFKVPYYVVRNKVDQDALNNKQDNDVEVEGTLREIRDELMEHGCDPSRTFLISAKHPECPDFDFARLLRAMAADAAQQRCELPEFHGDRPRTATRLIRRALSAPRRSLASGGGAASSGDARRAGEEEDPWMSQRQPSPQRQLQQLQQLHQEHGQRQEQQLLLQQQQQEQHLQQHYQLQRQQLQQLQLQQLQPPQLLQQWAPATDMEDASTAGRRHSAPSAGSSARPPSAPPPAPQRMQSMPELGLQGGASEASLLRALSFPFPAAAAEAGTAVSGLPLPPPPLPPQYCGGGGNGQQEGGGQEEQWWSPPSPQFHGGHHSVSSPQAGPSRQRASWTF